MKKVFILLFAIALMSGCDDGEFNEIFRNNLAPIPVNFPGATLTSDAPTFTFTFAGPATQISIPLEIPGGSGLTITEISRIAVGTIAINAGSLGGPAQFLTNPVPVGGTSFTYNTTISDLNNFGVNTDVSDATSDNPTTIAFIFELTLSDGQVLISREVEIDLIP